MASYKTNLELSGAYRFDPMLLRDIFIEATAFLKTEATISVNFFDVHRLDLSDIEDLLDDQLLRMHTISDIRIYGRNYETKPRRDFDFRARRDSFLGTISLEIEGTREDCTLSRNQIESLIRPKRQWYSLLYPSTMFDRSVLVLSVLLASLAAIFGLTLTSGVSVIEAAKATAALASISFVFVFALAWLRNQLFPRFAVEIGRSDEAWRRAASIRNFLFGTVVVSLIVGVLASLAANLLSK